MWQHALPQKVNVQINCICSSVNNILYLFVLQRLQAIEYRKYGEIFTGVKNVSFNEDIYNEAFP